jgi:hypothetical protein
MSESTTEVHKLFIEEINTCDNKLYQYIKRKLNKKTKVKTLDNTCNTKELLEISNKHFEKLLKKTKNTPKTPNSCTHALTSKKMHPCTHLKKKLKTKFKFG